ncbi:MAG: ATP-binding cassette domain-containing protein [Nitriliruptorales bacterium]|nr:ATP-binding cassette domain-containing protein [Nitriliruptorales bacterium]
MRVEITALGFAYPSPSGDRAVLRNLDLEVESAAMHAIVGKSGCGKSTLLNVIGGLRTPTSGTVEFRGTPRHRHRTAMVFETPRLVPWWTVERNVGIGSEFSDVRRSLYDRLVDFYTSHVGLGGLGTRFPATLSGGQRSRAGLGRALAHDGDVLLMDEPLAHLDALTRRRISIELEALLRIERRTTILSTHDIEEAVLFADRVSVMSSGPGPIVDTIEVGAPRPRAATSTAHPAIRSALARVWEALESS